MTVEALSLSSGAAFGKLSAPWLGVAFIAGTHHTTRTARGAALGLHPSCQETEPQRSNSYHDDPEAGWASTEMVLIDGFCSANQDKELQAASSLANPLVQ